VRYGLDLYILFMLHMILAINSDCFPEQL
jgi:hypothetical protein